MDVNPVADVVRVVNREQFNLRINPTTGKAVATDTALSYTAGDPNAASTPDVNAIAYTHVLRPGLTPTTTSLYYIDTNLDVLAHNTVSPNAGQLTTVGSLGFDADIAETQFDIGPTIADVESTWLVANRNEMWAINPVTGKGKDIGKIGSVTTVRGLAILP